MKLTTVEIKQIIKEELRLLYEYKNYKEEWEDRYSREPKAWEAEKKQYETLIESGDYESFLHLISDIPFLFWYMLNKDGYLFYDFDIQLEPILELLKQFEELYDIFLNIEKRSLESYIFDSPDSFDQKVLDNLIISNLDELIPGGKRRANYIKLGRTRAFSADVYSRLIEAEKRFPINQVYNPWIQDILDAMARNSETPSSVLNYFLEQGGTRSRFAAIILMEYLDWDDINEMSSEELAKYGREALLSKRKELIPERDNLAQQYRDGGSLEYPPDWYDYYVAPLDFAISNIGYALEELRDDDDEDTEW